MTKVIKKKSTSEKKFNYDVIIVGTGPGGEGASMELSKKDKKVAIIERYKDVGGGCTHWGTIPSKALRQSVSRLIEYNASPLFRGHNKAKHWLQGSHVHSTFKNHYFCAGKTISAN